MKTVPIPPNTFLSGLTTNDVVGENGMPANSTTDSAVLDLFFLLGTRSSGRRLTEAVDKAWRENPTLTLKCLFHSRDAREGKGERASFREAVKYLQAEFPVELIKLIPEFGRWDDLHELFNCDNIGQEAMDVVVDGLKAGNGLCAKWTPRKGPIASTLAKRMHLSPKEFRKLLVKLTNVVETPMCANKWKSIDFSRVPSKAGVVYSKAFFRHETERYTKWRTELLTSKSNAKINVKALYPHEIVREAKKSLASYDGTRSTYPFEAAWAKLQDLFPVTDAKIIPVCDVSGSMVGIPIEVTIALGMFLSQRNTGPFKDAFITFSGNPKLQRLSGSLTNRVMMLEQAEWEMNTNIHAVFKLIANAAKKAKPEDVPTTILIMSDMQFDECVVGADINAFAAYEKIFKELGVQMPKVVFWNLRDSGKNTIPVKSNTIGAALVSGFSPSLLKAIVNADLDESKFTPLAIMLNTLNVPRYANIKA